MRPIDTSAEEVVLDTMQSTRPFWLDNLVMQLPNYSWSKLFLAIDHMSREALVFLHRLTCSEYHVALPSRHASHHSPSCQKEAQPCCLSPHNFA